MLCPYERGEPFFQFGHFWAEDVLAVREHLPDARIDILLEPRVLHLKVDELHLPSHAYAVVDHVH